MTDDRKYYKLGLFLIIGSLLLIASIIIFGSAALFSETSPAETYFNESVEGLDIGSPVKFRGVKIGSVERIAFVFDKYRQIAPEFRRYVLVELGLHTELAPGVSVGEVGKNMQDLIDQGLRIRKNTQGLTGVAFLEVDFVDPKLNPPLPVAWEPDSLYIPSAPSTMSRVEAALGTISSKLEEFEHVDIGKFVDSVDGLLEAMDRTLREANVQSIGELVVQNLQELKGGLASLNGLLSDPEAKRLITDAAGTAKAMRAIAEENRGGIRETVSGAGQAARDAGGLMTALRGYLDDPSIRESLAKLPDTLQNISGTTAEIRTSAAGLSRLLSSLNDLTQEQRETIGALLKNADSLVRRLEHLSEDAQANPARVFFGAPPAPATSVEGK